MSRGFILTKGNDEIVLNIAAIDKLDGDSVYFNEGPQVSGIDEDVMISLNEAIAAYNPGGGGPTPGPEPVPAPPAEPYYVDGWFERPMNSVLVAAGTSFKIRFSDDASNWTTATFTAGDVDTWFNMEDQAFRQAKYIKRDNTSWFYDAAKAMKLDLPNYIGTGDYADSESTSRSIFRSTLMVNLDIKIDHFEITPNNGSLAYYFNRNNAMVTCKISMYRPELMTANNMQGMFSNCYALQSLDLSGWEVSSVTNMSSMFSGCYSLQSLDLSGWDTSSMTDMSNMFYQCYSLQSLDLSGLDVSKVTTMSYMFYYCYSLQSLDLSGWDMSSVTSMSNMFRDCSSLQSLDLSGWDASNATTMNSMFYNCRSLQSLDASGWDVSKVTDMSNMFANCYSLQSLDASGWNLSSMTSLSSMFKSCHSLRSLDLPGWIMPSVTNMSGMFQECYVLQSLDLSGWDVSSVTNMGNMFYNCCALQSLDLSGWSVSSVTSMSNMFYNCNALQLLDLSGWDISKVTTTMNNTFYQCYSLATLKITSKPKTIAFTFYSSNYVLNGASLKWIADNMIDITGDDSYTNKTITGFSAAVQSHSPWNYFVETLTAKGYTVS